MKPSFDAKWKTVVAVSSPCASLQNVQLQDPCPSALNPSWFIPMKTGQLLCTSPWWPALDCQRCKSTEHWRCRVTRWRSWLRHCARSLKVAGSIPDGFTRIFLIGHNPSGHTMALGSTQPLTEMSTMNIPWWVKAAGAQGWQPYHLHVPNVLKSGSLILLEPSGPVQGCNGTALPLPLPLPFIGNVLHLTWTPSNLTQHCVTVQNWTCCSEPFQFFVIVSRTDVAHPETFVSIYDHTSGSNSCELERPTEGSLDSSVGIAARYLVGGSAL